MRRHCTGKIYLGLIYEMMLYPLTDWLVSFIVLGFLPDDKEYTDRGTGVKNWKIQYHISVHVYYFRQP